jgi:hypothetical protein
VKKRDGKEIVKMKVDEFVEKLKVEIGEKKWLFFILSTIILNRHFL